MKHTRRGLFAVATALALWFGMLLCLEVGRRIGIAQLRSGGPEMLSGTSAINGAIFSLLALLLGFMFNGAANRFDQRRKLIVELANTMGTAWRRLALLTPDRQAEVRPLFPRYVEALLEAITPRPNVDPLRAPADLMAIRDDIWSRSVAACTTPSGEVARMLLLPSLSEMFVAVERGRMMRRVHPPILIVIMLGVTELAASLFAGYSLAAMPTRNWLYLIGFATAIALTTLVILDFEYPRLGFMRITDMDQELADVHAEFSVHAVAGGRRAAA